MKIKTYIYRSEEDPKWNFSKVELRKLNLLVGNSGAGKTRFLNTVFNLGVNVAAERAVLKTGYWNVCLELEGVTYEWELEIGISDPIGAQV